MNDERAARDRRMRVLVEGGQTLAEVGELYGVSRQRVAQIVGTGVARVGSRKRAARARDAQRRERMRSRRTRWCYVCGQPFTCDDPIMGNEPRTCSTEHARLYHRYRRYFDPEALRINRESTVKYLAHRGNRVQRAWGRKWKKVIDAGGRLPPPRHRFMRPQTYRAIEAVVGRARAKELLREQGIEVKALPAR